MVTLHIFSVMCVLTLLIEKSTVIGFECGKVEYLENKILGGQLTARGEWPFIVALYYTDNSKFFCGGTLISSKHTLTAAHCIHQKDSAKKLFPENVVVLLGAYNLDLKIEKGTEQRNVDKIYIHPDWNAFNDKYDADLAILVLSEFVKFTNLIHPVCLPNTDIIMAEANGSIVGWGLAEHTKINEHESMPRKTFSKVLNDTYCYTTNHLLALLSSSRTFCGSGEEGTPNKGDSGGGFFVLSGSSWVQFGIISAALSDEAGRVNANSMCVYTNVKSFKKWIDEIIFPPVVDLLTLDNKNEEQIELICNYEIILDIDYRCTISDLNVTNENLKIVAFTGFHIPGYRAQDVAEIWFWAGTSAYIPKGIGKMFTNLEKFMVSDGDRNLGLKVLRRSNFENMEYLWYLNVRSNEIETVDEDTFMDLPNLTDFVISYNNLRVIHKNTFISNLRLISVNAKSNKLEFLHSDLFKMNLQLEEVLFNDNKLVTILIDFTQLKKIKKIDFRENICFDKALSDIHSLGNFQRLLRYHCD